MSGFYNLSVISPLSMQIAAYLPTAIILPLGLVANISAFVALIQYKRTRAKNLIYYFIGSLILYDLALLAIYWPIALIKRSTSWPFGRFLCYVSNIFPIFYNSGPSFIMIAMIVDRYRVLVNQANPNPTLCRKVIILTVIAVLALAIAIPDLIFTYYGWAYTIFIGSSQLTYQRAYVCTVAFYYLGSLNPWRIYFTTLYLSLYIVPLIVTVVLFFITKSKLKNRLQNDSVAASNDTDIRLLRMTLCLMIASVFFWSGKYIFFILYHFRVYSYHFGGYRRFQFANILVQHFTLISTVANPIIFGYYIPEIKRALIHVFTCGCLRRLRRSEEQSDVIKLTEREA